MQALGLDNANSPLNHDEKRRLRRVSAFVCSQKNLYFMSKKTNIKALRMRRAFLKERGQFELTKRTDLESKPKHGTHNHYSSVTTVLARSAL